MASFAQTPTFSFSATLPSSWQQIEPLRSYVEACVQGTGSGLADRASLVLQELLENAVKYGDPMEKVRVEVELFASGAIVIRVGNKAQPARLAVLQKEFQRTNVGDDARQAFARALGRLKKLPEGTSMLGLPRLAMESKLSLDIHGDLVTVTARVE